MPIPSKWGDSLFNNWFQTAWVSYMHKNKVGLFSYLTPYKKRKSKSIKDHVRPKSGKLLKYSRVY